MNAKLFCVLVLVQTCFGDSMFFHQPSQLVLGPDKELQDKADFSFSMGYQKELQRLVVGSPHADSVGQVYGCPIDRYFNKTTCNNLNIDVEKLTPDYDKNNTAQKFCLGATIATTSKYFLTCAPLWTTTVYYQDRPQSGSYGTCFIYNNDNETHQLQDIVQQKKYSKIPRRNEHALRGGLGWSSLADEENEVLLIAKTFDIGDIQYIKSKDLELNEKRPTNSLYFSGDESLEKYVHDHINIGYALAAGKFFSDFKKTVYAFTMRDEQDGTVDFLYYEKDGKEQKMKILLDKDENPITIQSKDLGDMYGAAMCSADMDSDNLSDLLVGAPTHAQRGTCETGALYIHFGDTRKNMRKQSNWLVVVSSKPRSRFGSAIATSDLDGDSLPEVFVSAPYEDSGKGALYIISGHELIKTIRGSNLKKKYISVKLEKLKWTQTIRKEEFKSFGLSLQVINDVNENGCDDVAVGSPRSSAVMLLRCIPTVKADLIFRRLSNEVLKPIDTNYTVEVCVNVTYQLKPENISTKFKVVSKVVGKGASLKSETFEVDLFNRNTLNCGNVTVNLRKGEIGVYQISSNLEYVNEDVFANQEFDPTWVRLSRTSNLHNNMSETRFCDEINEIDCMPKLDMVIKWGDSNPPTKLIVSEKTSQTVNLSITNDGANAYDACVGVKVSGAKLSIKCPQSDDDPDEYRCPLPRPLEKGDTHNANFTVGIEKVTNVDDTVHVEVALYNDCNYSPDATRASRIDVELRFDAKDVKVINETRDVHVTNTQIKKKKNSKVKHEYKIVNTGSLEWNNVVAIIHVQKKAFIENYEIEIKPEERRCDKKDDTADSVEFLCAGIKVYDNPVLIQVRTEIPYSKIPNSANAKLEIESTIEVRMTSDDNQANVLRKSLISTVNYDGENGFERNIAAIICISIFAALLILSVIALTLYKCGFFKSEGKSRIESLKAKMESEEKGEADGKPSTSGVSGLNADSKEDDMDDFDIEVIDDCPFNPVPLDTSDETALIEDKNKPKRSKSSSKSTSSQVDKHASQPDVGAVHSTTVADVHSVTDDKNMPPEKPSVQNRQSTKI